jgi:hypothetical protein
MQSENIIRENKKLNKYLNWKEKILHINFYPYKYTASVMRLFYLIE